MENLTEEEVRLLRLKKINDLGINAFPASTKRTHTILEVKNNFENIQISNEEFSIAGRVMIIRKHGGLSFIVLRDETGEFQIVMHKEILGENYDKFHEIADIGDFFSFTGKAFVTRKGENSLDASDYQILTKSLLPLPEKWHGLTDTEKRYRYRYLDFIANDESFNKAKLRSSIVKSIRQFLDSEGFIEVETPVLQPIAGGTTAKPFTTHHDTLDHDFFLRIAPELYLKRLLVGGFEKIYEYARCYRNEGISPQHNPEFTQIELYWAYADINDLINHLENLLEKIISENFNSNTVMHGETALHFNFPLPRLSFRDAVLQHSGIDIDIANNEESLKQEMKNRGMKTESIGYAELADDLYKTFVRPKIIQPTFITDYPSAMKPLAKKRDDNPHYSAGAQFLVMGTEVWNAFNELNNPLEQEERFREQEELRERGHDGAQRIDHDFLKALRHGMPPAAGYGLGIDRLVMLLTGANNLKEVILFPTLKPENDTNEE
jgi:lysyl-tRNA synthetase class 2